MTDDAFDMLVDFTCENPKCRNGFQKVLRDCVKPEEVFCPACGHSQNIKEAKLHGPLGKLFDTATEINKQRVKPK